MKRIAFTLAALGVVSLAACNQPPPPQRDTGNMAYPRPLPQGNLSTTAAPRSSTDTGNMAYPTPSTTGQVGTTAGSATRDTGNMAYPAPRPSGRVGTTVVQ